MAYVLLSFGVNTNMVGSASAMDAMLMNIDDTTMMPIDILNNRFNCTWSRLPY